MTVCGLQRRQLRGRHVRLVSIAAGPLGTSALGAEVDTSRHVMAVTSLLTHRVQGELAPAHAMTSSTFEVATNTASSVDLLTNFDVSFEELSTLSTTLRASAAEFTF